MGELPRPHALPRAGRGGHRDRLGCERDPVDPDRHGQVARRGGRARGIPLPGWTHVLHRTDQGAGEREVLRPRRHLRRRERRYGHGRFVGQLRRPDHLLHRRDPREPRPAARRRRERGPGRHGRVPLLRRGRPRLGLAGAAAAAHARAVHPHVGDPGGCHRHRRRPLASHRSAHRAGDRRRAPRAAALRVRAHPRARDGAGVARHEAGADLRRALLAGRGHGARSGAVVDPHHRPRAARRDRRGDRRLPLHDRLRQDAVALRACGHRRAPRRHVAEVSQARGDPCTAGAAACHLRHRHPGRRHQRAHPHRAHDRADQVRRHPHAPALGARVPSDRGARGPGRLRHRRNRRRHGTRPRDRERRADPQGRRRPQEAEEDRAQKGAAGLRQLDRAELRPPRRGRARTAAAADEAVAPRCSSTSSPAGATCSATSARWSSTTTSPPRQYELARRAIAIFRTLVQASVGRGRPALA